MGVKYIEIRALARGVRIEPETLPAWATDPTGSYILSMQNPRDLLSPF